jgi:hypothetical protein
VSGHETFFKGPRRRTTKQRRASKARSRKQVERDRMLTVRERDGQCRLFACGCREPRNRDLIVDVTLEVSHQAHRGMGGNPALDRSETRTMVLLCHRRHQTGLVSRHAGTLRPVFLTPDGFDGPIAWEIQWAVLERLGLQRCVIGRPRGEWVRVSEETSFVFGGCREGVVLEPMLLDRLAVWNDGGRAA